MDGDGLSERERQERAYKRFFEAGATAVEEGAAADRERYVTERAEFLARAHHAAMGDAMREETEQAVIVGPWERMPEQRRRIMVAVMRTLIDKGVLK